MPTNLALDDELIDEAVKAGGHKTKREAVTAALREYVKARKRLGILDWVGEVDYFDDYDAKALRRAKKR
jgi:Arc/MetJ family transcription regulator